MLLIKTTVKLTPEIPGGDDYGLFTNESIIKGQPVWKDDCVVISENTMKVLSDYNVSKYLMNYATVFNGKWQYDTDNMKFINHSSNPNIIFVDNIAVATENIMMGQELFCDYSKITEDWHYKKLLNIK